MPSQSNRVHTHRQLGLDLAVRYTVKKGYLVANFNTHLTYAVAGSGLLGTLCLKSDYVSAPDALIMTLAGTLGGILPDIDLKYSYPSKLLFSLLALLGSLLWMFSSNYPISILELWVLGLGLYLFVRYPVWFTFHKLAIHRGSIHSVAAALLAAFVTSIICDRFLQKPAFICWLVALAMFCGYILHLLLDELYSVDFMNVRVKRSFGTALKLIDTRYIAGSCLILVLCLSSWFYTPNATEFVATLRDHNARTSVIQKLLPRQFLDYLKTL